MVMHARKQQRLNDGYADRKDVSHLHQNMQYQSKGYGRSSYSDRYETDASERLRDDSPDSRHSPRYYHKSSYNDRFKEKRNKGPYEKKGNSLMSVAASIRSGNGSYHNRDRHPPPSKSVSSSYNRDTIRESSREPSRSEPIRSEPGRSEPGRSEPGRSEPGRSEPKEKDHRTEVQKTALRVCGDWSEHVSSSGKGYYYNCKTEVSQWEKPKEWIDSPKTPESSRTKDNRTPSKSYSSTGRSGEDRSKHSGGSDRNYDKSRSNVGNSSDLYTSDCYIDTHKDNSNIVVPHGGSNAYHRSNSSSSDHYYPDSYSDSRKNSTYPYSMVDPSRVRNRHDSSDNRLTPLGQGHKNNHSQSHEDMDISPGSTPTSSRPPSSSGTHYTHPTSTSGVHHTSRLAPIIVSNTSPVNLNTILPLTASSNQTGNDESESIKQRALQTLQKLQAALHLQIERAQHWTQPSNGPPPTAEEMSLSSPTNNQRMDVSHSTQLPNLTSAAALPSIQTDLPIDNGASPLSELSSRDSCHSPANSTTSSQNAPINTSALSGAGFSKKDQSAELVSTFSNYYNEKLINHVMGWQADLAEREAKRYWQEALTVGSLQCAQVSVELTKARSLVRVAEIESTLHEQRILFLDKQIAEIENLKPPSSILS